jgi:phosphotransferase system  glucose/maltose/N-acetylglucosamine-specific IIC component
MKLITKDISFYKKVAAIAIPVAMQGLITTGVNMMDTIMVGALGETALSAVSLANLFINIFHIFCMGIGMGAMMGVGGAVGGMVGGMMNDAVVSATNNANTTALTDDMAAFKAKIDKLTMMKEAGMLSEEEFNSMKAKLLSEIL